MSLIKKDLASQVRDICDKAMDYLCETLLSQAMKNADPQIKGSFLRETLSDDSGFQIAKLNLDDAGIKLINQVNEIFWMEQNGKRITQKIRMTHSVEKINQYEFSLQKKIKIDVTFEVVEDYHG